MWIWNEWSGARRGCCGGVRGGRCAGDASPRPRHQPGQHRGRGGGAQRGVSAGEWCTSTTVHQSTLVIHIGTWQHCSILKTLPTGLRCCWNGIYSDFEQQKSTIFVPLYLAPTVYLVFVTSKIWTFIQLLPRILAWPRPGRGCGHLTLNLTVSRSKTWLELD